MERTSKGEKSIELCGREYISAKNYAEFILMRLRSGGVSGTIMRVYRKIRKYTLFTAVIRGIAVVVTLLEKSALLLLVFSSFLLLLPLALIPLMFCAVLSVIGYFRFHGAVKSWVSASERVSVYVTSERFFGTRRRRRAKRYVCRETAEKSFSEAPLFARCAMLEAGEYTHPVIVVCSDPFLTAKWAGFNLLAVKCDYFFILRRYYLKEAQVSFFVLS